ncbi:MULTISPECIES: sigma-54 dependent transcriptional regulator [Myxococcus]|uniref:Sigma-54-dependent Fis family transcriptional regulator n=1 Tax=Myxococcus llanfairpwllgwyngyllgogerychwyrndrobwllllantysiliogogogochensis TaxID=2590453 RepID=A0A540WJV7_9BACT|nr:MULTISPECIES: sigma-54 dependent transcriptional regulator [Myxococcus]NTX08491.1 sigma-54-dependent Fis family transcriptional regulator [Myxococcus sp. CA040A]NTX16766.1 sigma-54-dependent Fis family transcriptional regulator [Myxococcus sp. CA056]TQF09300.1 sigma-54-dependent Fis family transcriptional regulator [Myxococcus llanfairpwllgwyngyllgogerychwyrndrobwllllantysiliogogogochensis]
MSIHLLLVDDDRTFASLAATVLRHEGFRVTLAHSLHDARAALARQAPEVVVLDRRLPDGDGIHLLPELRAQFPDTAVMMVTAHGDIASAVDAIKQGARDYLSKPVELDDLVLRARRAAADLQLHERLRQAESELGGRRRLLRPRAPAMVAALQMIERIATAPRSPVLITGETGAGKEVLARHLHNVQGNQGPFVHVNCAALPSALVESELFGHERGAFTDARAARRGLVEVADGGILFLDEIGELPLSLQAKLLTFLDQGAFRRLGGTTELTSNARVVTATNRDLTREVAESRFREDLYFRLSVFRVEIPPLRQRREDVLPLAESLLVELCAELGRRPVDFSSAARARLERYPFPGNVRELRNVLERALVLEPGPALELQALEPRGPLGPAATDPDAFVVSGTRSLDEVERLYVKHVLGRLDGRRMEAAKALGLSYPTFLRKLEE